MHNLLEGCIRHNIKELMNYLSKTKIYSVQKLNRDLKNFNYGIVDSKNKVPDSLFTDNSTFKISATHTWTLLRLLPIFIGEELKNNSYFLNFLEIIEIFKSLNNDEFDDIKLENLAASINNYLTEFKRLYKLNIIAKQHFLIHYPNIIKKFGPPLYYNTMRFEAKHSYFKSVHQSVHNHINLNLSLVSRHQNLQVYHLLCPNYFVDFELGTQHNIDFHLASFINMFLPGENYFYKWVVKRGIKYQLNNILATSLQNNIPSFSIVKAIIYENNSDIFFLLQDIQTLEYITYLASYKIKENETMMKTLNIDNLKNKWPLDLYNYKDFKIITPKIPLK